MNCENCFKKCPIVGFFRNEIVDPDDLTISEYTSDGWIDTPKAERDSWELESPSGKHRNFLARIRPQAYKF